MRENIAKEDFEEMSVQLTKLIQTYKFLFSFHYSKSQEKRLPFTQKIHLFQITFSIKTDIFFSFFIYLRIITVEF